MKNIFRRKFFATHFFLALVALLIFIANDSNAFTCGTSTVNDSDSNNYSTVQIGDQCWMKESMEVGTMLTSASTMPTNDSVIEKWCYGNSTTNCTNQGGLYTWSEANQLASTCLTTSCTLPVNNQGICPSGWHIPTDAEYKTLEMYLGMTQAQADAKDWRGTNQGSKLSTQTLNGVNSSGFTGLLAGTRNPDNAFYDRGTLAYLWSGSEYSATNGWVRALYSGYTTIYRDTSSKAYGFSVRCAKNIELQAKTVISPISQDITEDINTGYISLSGTNIAAKSVEGHGISPL